MLQSLKNIFANNDNDDNLKEYNEIDILSGLMIEAANTDGKITQEEYTRKNVRILPARGESPSDYTIVTRELLRTSKGITDLLLPTASTICHRYNCPSK